MSDDIARLRAELEALYPLVGDAERLQQENEVLRTQLDASRRRITEVTYQRDRNRHQLLRMKNRRFWRLAEAVNSARRSLRGVFALPITVLRVLFGSAPMLPPAPTSPDEEEPQHQESLRAPAESRRVTELRHRFLAPPTPASTTDLRVAGILDTFSASCFGPDCHLDTRFRPDNWREALESNPPHLLLVESAWKGNGGAWEYQVGTYSYPESVGLPPLSALVEWCRERGIPTVFWNKEDPVHFDKFKQAASRFDVVLTTDADSLERYAALPGLQASNMGALPFAAQPAIHTPLGASNPREPVPVFAGTYYRNRHEDRRAQLEMLLDAAAPFGLVIFDRMHGATNESTGFPERFVPHLRGGLPYDEMVRAYRRYRVFLNTNSVTNSPTMFSRRVFELLSSGTPVVSTPSVGMERMLGSVVRTVASADEVRDSLRELLEDEPAWRRTSAAGLQLVLSEHTYAHRLGTIARAAGLEVATAGEADVTVLVLDDGDLVQARFGAVLANLLPHATALVGSSVMPTGHGTHPQIATLHQDQSAERDERLRQLAAHAETRWVAIVDGSATDLEAIGQLRPARRLAPAEVLIATHDAEVAYTDEVAAGPALVSRDLVMAGGWRSGGDPVTRGHHVRTAGGRCLQVMSDAVGTRRP